MKKGSSPTSDDQPTGPSSTSDQEISQVPAGSSSSEISKAHTVDVERQRVKGKMVAESSLHDPDEMLSLDPHHHSSSSSTISEAHTIDVVRRVIRKVSPELRMKGKMVGGSSLYDPVMVSLGPHHHGKPELRQAEAFKEISLAQFIGDGANGLNRENLHECILKKIGEVRSSYAEVSLANTYNNKYDNDGFLAEMMLLDACFIIRYIEIRTTESNNDDEDVWSVWRNHLGDSGCHRSVERDIMVMENQIPFFVLKLVISQKYSDVEGKYSEAEGKNLVAKFLGWALFTKNVKPLPIPREEDDPPLHILAAFRRVLVQKTSTTHDPIDHRRTTMIKANNYYTCGSVTDLKAKGIYFGTSSSHSFQDIKFSSRVLYGKLQLPIRYICDGTLVNFSNMIAYELCPRSNRTDLEVCSYISLMKSLIQTPADVKELQEGGVFALNRFANQEQVVEMFKTFDTLDLDNKDIYQDVMNTIGRHSKSKVKTWIAYDLIQTALRSPCTAVAWLSAIAFFALTCVSVHYAIHPPDKKKG